MATTPMKESLRILVKKRKLKQMNVMLVNLKLLQLYVRKCLVAKQTLEKSDFPSLTVFEL